MRRFVLGVCVASIILAACGDSGTPNSPLYGTWLFNGSKWTQLAGSSGAESKKSEQFPAGEQLNYWPEFGGLVDSDGTRWDGRRWVVNGLSYPALPNTQAFPSIRTFLVFDEGRKQLVFLDPNSGTIWTSSHGNWEKAISMAQWPNGLSVRGAAYDPTRREVVILVCCDVAGLGPQTWVWNGTAPVVRSGGLPGLDEYALVPDGNGHLLERVADVGNAGVDPLHQLAHDPIDRGQK